VPAPKLAVLVVDDVADALAAISTLLGHAGCTVRVARSGAEAVEMVSRWPVDVAIIDLSMPGMDGFAVAARIRTRAGSQPLLIALTGLAETEAGPQAQAVTFDHFFGKPADPDQLCKLLREHAARIGRVLGRHPDSVRP